MKMFNIFKNRGDRLHEMVQEQLKKLLLTSILLLKETNNEAGRYSMTVQGKSGERYEIETVVKKLEDTNN